MRGVLDHGNPVMCRDGMHGVNVSREPGDVHGHHRLRPARDCTFDQRRIDVQCPGLDVDKDRPGVEIADDLRRRGKRIRRRYHLVAALQSYRVQREVHGGGAGIDSDRMLRAHDGPEFRLELFRLRSGCHPAGPEGFFNLPEFFAVKVGEGKWKELLSHCRSIIVIGSPLCRRLIPPPVPELHKASEKPEAIGEMKRRIGRREQNQHVAVGPPRREE